MKQADNYITKEKEKALKIELKELKGPKRKEILEELAHAKSLGDLSENAEYHEARAEQANLEERITKIEIILKNATIVSHKKKDAIGIGSIVKITREGEKEIYEFEIAGSEESGLGEGKISHSSPLGSCLMGRKKEIR